ncbi:MAG TPA: hypothetical protein DCG10_05775 [Lachnospiraceae bacterium]|nr:hypothetical protein [Lachnospiraceae bacterium]
MQRLCTYKHIRKENRFRCSACVTTHLWAKAVTLDGL